jgi:hypothetical protein
MTALAQPTTSVEIETKIPAVTAREIADKIQFALDLLDETESLLCGSSNCPDALWNEVAEARVCAEYAIGEAENWVATF